MQKYSNEERLIFLSSVPPERNRFEIERLLGKDLDWASIVTAAFSLELVLLVNNGLSPFYGSGKVPHRVIHAFKDKVQFSVGLNLGYLDEVKRLLLECRKVGIRVCLLKGAALAFSVYQSLSLRSFCDVDILVREEELEKVVEVFSVRYDVDSFLPIELCKKHHFHVPLVRKKKPAYNFEIHWSVFPQDACIDLPSSFLWKDVRDYHFKDVFFTTLSPENTVLHIIIHFTRNAFSSPKDLWDIYWLMSVHSVDLSELSSRIKQFNLERRAAVFFNFFDCFFETSYVKRLGLESSCKLLAPVFSGAFSIASLVRKEYSKDSMRVLTAFLLQNGFFRKFYFLLRLVYPGILGLSVYTADLSNVTFKTRVKIALRGFYLCLYLLSSAV